MQQTLKTRFPKQPEEVETIYNKAIAARAFDTLRGFLPAGTSTNLAWHMNLRQFADELDLLRHHPLAEVRSTAQTVEEALLRAYPSSFSEKRYAEKEAYNAELMKTYYFDGDVEEFTLTRNDVDRTQLAHYRQLLESRPAKTELPRRIAECGTVQFEFLLDFGSFRDIQRHRAVKQRMPLLTPRHGFHPWYLDELPQDMRNHATRLIDQQTERVAALHVTPEIAQYYLPIGYKTANRLVGDLHALTYLVELRSTRFVHPTLRERARQMASTLLREFGGDGLTLHLDTDPDRFDAKRGTHDIVRIE